MCKANSLMSLENANEVHSSKHVAPPRCKEESQVNSTSWKSRGRNTIMAEPLKCGTKVNHQSMSDSISLVTGKRDGLEGKLHKRFKRRDINIRPGRTQAVTNDSFPSNDCNWRRVKVENCVHCNNSVLRCDKRSAATVKSIFSVCTKIPRQIILLEGWQSFSGDDCRPSSSNKSWRSAKAKWESAGCSGSVKTV